MGEWLRSGGAASRLAFRRADLWLPGALGFLAYFGWLPLVVTVAPAPDAGDVAFLGVRIVSASAFPWNLVALIAVVGGLLLLLCLIAAVAETALIEGVSSPPRGPRGASALAAFSVIVLAAIPVTGALGALMLAVSAVAPGYFFSPASLLEIVARLLTELWPYLAVLLVLLLVAQAFGAVAMRFAIRRPSGGLSIAMTRAVRDVAAHPLRRLGTALAATTADLVALSASALLLRLLWTPIGEDLAAGRVLSLRALLLLLGFVAIWLGLLLAAGALRAWFSAWWTLETAAQPRGGHSDES